MANGDQRLADIAGPLVHSTNSANSVSNGVAKTVAPLESTAGVLNCTLGTESDPSAVLASLYEAHQAGWRLTVIEPSAADRTPGNRHRFVHRRPTGRFTADSLSTLLFRNGFVDTRVETKKGIVTATALREN